MNSDPHSPIGLLDSGLGGITIWAEIRRTLPCEEVIYWADSAHCPYGQRSREEITRLVSIGVEELLNRGVKIIVIACNTATTAAIDTLRRTWPDLPFVGLEPAIKPAARQTQSNVIGLLATRYTLQSDMYRQTAATHAANIRILAIPGDGLVELAEAGLQESPQAEQLLRQYIEPMLEAGADQLVLACTHYPLFTPLIERIIQQSDRPMHLINPAGAIARHTRTLLEESHLLNPSTHPGTSVFLSTSGPEEAIHLAQRAEQYTLHGH